MESDQAAAAEAAKRQQQEELRQNVLSRILTQEARERCTINMLQYLTM